MGISVVKEVGNTADSDLNLMKSTETAETGK